MTDELTKYICNLQALDTKNVISEVMTSGLTNDDIIIVMNTITFSKTWKFESLKTN